MNFFENVCVDGYECPIEKASQFLQVSTQFITNKLLYTQGFLHNGHKINRVCNNKPVFNQLNLFKDITQTTETPVTNNHVKEKTKMNKIKGFRKASKIYCLNKDIVYNSIFDLEKIENLSISSMRWYFVKDGFYVGNGKDVYMRLKDYEQKKQDGTLMTIDQMINYRKRRVNKDMPKEKVVNEVISLPTVEKEEIKQQIRSIAFDVKLKEVIHKLIDDQEIDSAIKILQTVKSLEK